MSYLFTPILNGRVKQHIQKLIKRWYSTYYQRVWITTYETRTSKLDHRVLGLRA